MSNVNPYPIDVEEFHSWLLAQPPTAIVGKSCDDEACPLAAFLNAHYVGSSFLVHCCDYERNMDDISLGRDLEPERFPLPEWAQEYVYVVDVLAHGVESPINRYDAYQGLQSVCYGCNISLGGQVPTWKEQVSYGS